MVKLVELLDKYKNLAILNRLVELYDTEAQSIEGYEAALNELRSLEPSDNAWVIVVTVWEGNGVSVSGVLEGDPDFYAIEFRPWDEWLGMGIRDEDLQEIGHLSMLCHCLYELTFVGFSNEEVGTKWRELKSMNDELDKQLESGEFVFEDVDTFLDALDGE